MKVLPTAPQGLRGTLQVPGDKSISHRSLMIGAISEGTTTVENFLTGEDCLSTLQAFRDLGVQIEQSGTDVTIHGVGLTGLKTANHALDMGNSGTTTRLMMGLLAGQPFDSHLIGDNSLQKRPMKRVAEPLAQFGGQIELTESGTLPATVHGQTLHATNYQLKVASAQVKSALILAALQADGPSTIKELLPTRDHTEIMLRQFGADVQTAADGVTITVQPHPHLTGQHVVVPSDISSAAFFLVAGALTPNSDVTLTNVNLNPTRTGIITVLQKMQADLTITPRESAGEPLGDLRIKTSDLQPIELGATDIPAVIDELPLVALLASRAQGQSVIRGAEELRVKETDRIATVVAELRKFGVRVEELPDGMIIDGCPDWDIQNHQLDSYGDHRLGMMDAIAALTGDGEMTLANEGAVAVSYPTFFDDLEHLLGGGHDESIN